MQNIERHRYTQDRLWDVRKEAYTSIIAGLRSATRHADAVNEGFNSGEMHPEEYFQSEGYSKQLGSLWDKWNLTKEDFESSRLLLSDNFVNAFEALESNLNAIDRDDNPPAIYMQVHAVFDASVTPMLEIGKAEIAPPPPTDRV